MITGGKITYVEAKRENDDQISGLDINIAIDNVQIEGKKITVSYTYTATYTEGVGSLTIKGMIFSEDDEKKAKEIRDNWKEKKKLPDDFAETILNTINFTCGTNGTLVVRPVNLSPPMIPPRIQLRKGEAHAKA